MKQVISLKSSREFKRLYKKGKSCVDKNAVLYTRKNGLTYNRLGITVSAKVGCAVKRNLVRRRIREAYRLSVDEFKKGYDLIYVARVRAAGASYRSVRQSVLTLAKNLDLFEGTP